jgi:putative membrane protein
MMGFGLLVPILVIVALAYAWGWLPPNQERNLRQQKEKRTGSTALDILEERYARGEISREEYLEMRDDLSR